MTGSLTLSSARLARQRRIVERHRRSLDVLCLAVEHPAANHLTLTERSMGPRYVRVEPLGAQLVRPLFGMAGVPDLVLTPLDVPSLLGRSPERFG